MKRASGLFLLASGWATLASPPSAKAQIAAPAEPEFWHCTINRETDHGVLGFGWDVGLTPNFYQLAFYNPPGGDMRFNIHWYSSELASPPDNAFATFRLTVPKAKRGMTLQLWRDEHANGQQAAMGGSEPTVGNALTFQIRLSELRALAAGKPVMSLVAVDRRYRIVARAQFDTALLAAADRLPVEQRAEAARLSADATHLCARGSNTEIVVT